MAVVSMSDKEFARLDVLLNLEAGHIRVVDACPAQAAVTAGVPASQRFPGPRCREPRSCRQLRRMVAAASWMPARKVRASVSYRVAMPLKCLSLLKKRSTRLRSLYRA